MAKQEPPDLLYPIADEVAEAIHLFCWSLNLPPDQSDDDFTKNKAKCMVDLFKAVKDQKQEFKDRGIHSQQMDDMVCRIQKNLNTRDSEFRKRMKKGCTGTVKSLRKKFHTSGLEMKHGSLKIV